MSEKPDGGPAFPSSAMEDVFVEEFGRYVERLGPPQGGMTLRDYFAAKAMQASLASPELLQVVTSAAIGNGTAAERCARASYLFADAMIAEREK